MASPSMSPTALRDFVRTHLDVDSTELPNSLLDVFLIDGFNRVIGWFDESPSFYEVEYSFDTIASTQAYNLDTTSGLISPTPLQFIHDVRGPTWSLQPADHRGMRKLYRTESAPAGTPTRFSIYGRTLYLWPPPATVRTYTITGLRQPQDWLTSSAPPDCPNDFHELIAFWALNRGYAQQDDPQMASFYRDEFTAELKNRGQRYVHGNDAVPFQINGGRQRDKWRTEHVLGPLIYDWE